PLFLHDHRVAFETIAHPPAYTADRRARQLHVKGGNVAKCVLLACPRGYTVAVLPATHRVDLDEAAQFLGTPVRLANETEIAEQFGDCEWGGLAPFGTLYGLSTIVDESLDPLAPVVFQAHRHALAIRMQYGDYAR